MTCMQPSGRVRPVHLLLGLALIATSSFAAAGGERICDELRVAAGQNLGAVADPTGSPSCGNFTAAPRDVLFQVTTLRGHVLVDVEVAVTLQHDWAGDLVAHLIGPDATPQPVFGRVGAASLSACGDGSDLDATYAFRDDHAGNLWQVAATANDTATIAGGDYYPTNVGGFSGLDLRTSLRGAFAGIPSEAANGTWTLELLDTGVGDAGVVSGASLTLCFLTTGIFADGFEASHAAAVR